MGHPVLSAAEYFNRESDSIVIIAVASDKIQKEIQEYLRSLYKSIEVVCFENW